MVNKIAVKSTAGVIYEGSNELLKENDYEFFKEATPANLKFLEGLWASDRSNKKLLTLLIKGYAAYTFAVLETNALKDLLLEEESPATERVIITYEKAIKYGMLYLSELGISQQEFNDKSFANKLNEKFSSIASEDDHVALFYFAQALGSSINLQRKNVNKMSKLSHVRELLSWVCSEDPELENGSCGLFSAVIEASTPSLLGGSVEKAKLSFKKAIKKYPSNLLVRLSYIQYYLIPMLEEEEYASEIRNLNRDINIWYKLQLGEKVKDKFNFNKNTHFNLYNSLAKKRLSIFKKVEREIF